MNKITPTSVDNKIKKSGSVYSGSVWSKENEKLIEKLESAYTATSEKNSTNQGDQFYGIKFNSISLLIDKNTPSELLDSDTVYPLPMTVDWIIGVSNIRGDIIPIIDFEKTISDEGINSHANNRKIMIINKGEDAIGLLLDQLPKLISFNNQTKLRDYSNLPKSIRDYVNYAYTQGESTWVCIDIPTYIQSIETY